MSESVVKGLEKAAEWAIIAEEAEELGNLMSAIMAWEAAIIAAEGYEIADTYLERKLAAEARI